MQWGAEASTLNRKTHIVELRGNAYVFRDYEEIHADEIDLDRNTEYVKARGRVRYQYGDYFIRADSVDIDMKKRVGTVINGNISNGQFALRGSRIDQIADKHYLVEDYSYSTCYDCPGSWEMTGKHVDITVDQYAYMNDFMFKILDTGLFWLPYMVIPVKTHRQSGLLFPRFGTNGTYGPYVVEPYYWAINHWSDATLGLGYYSYMGVRFEGEARYQLTNQSGGLFSAYWTRDQSVSPLYFRYAVKAGVTQELPFGIEGKLRLNEVSDSGYPITFADDIEGRLEPVLTSDLFFTRDDPQLSAVLDFKRIRNLLLFNNTPGSTSVFVNGFDGGTVQDFPHLVVNSNDQFIFGSKVAVGMEGRFDSFRRSAGAFDFFPNPTVGAPPLETIREADRFTLIPNVYTTLNPLPWLSVVPSVKYPEYVYTFGTIPQVSEGVVGNTPFTVYNPEYPTLARGYLLAQIETSFQLDKNFAPDKEGVSFRNTIKPQFTYSRIPVVQQPLNHPFIEQIQNQAKPGQYFDSYDIVPIGTTQNLDSYFTPLGNSLTYGLTTQVFRKEQSKDPKGDGDPSVSKRFEAGLEQTLDIHEAQRTLDPGQADDRVILSPLFTHFQYTEPKFSTGLEYTYYSYLDRYQHTGLATLLPSPNPHRVNIHANWLLDSATRQGVLHYERSIGVGYSFSRLTSEVSSVQGTAVFSLNDYLMSKGSVSYNLVPYHNQLLDTGLDLVFQSSSRCWQLDLGYLYTVDRGRGPTLQFALNLDGNPYGPLKK